VREVIKKLKEKHDDTTKALDPDVGCNKKVFVTAPTGMAAINIDGQTIHSYAGIFNNYVDWKFLANKNRNGKIGERLKRTRVLVIDEISMISCHLFDKVDNLMRDIRGNQKPFGGVQVIVLGDFFQLPPIADDEEDPEGLYAFCSEGWRKTFDECFNFSEVIRQKNDRFIRVLNNMRVGKLTADDERYIKSLSRPLNLPHGIIPVNLFSRKIDVENMNLSFFKKIKEHEEIYVAIRDVRNNQVKLLEKCQFPMQLKLKVGAQVMLLKNKDNKHVNGSTGIVIKFVELESTDKDGRLAKRNFPVVRFRDGDELPITDETWEIRDKHDIVLAFCRQVPLDLAWAATIHKYQGQTVDAGKINLKNGFSKGQPYVALSRVKTPECLQVLKFSPDLCKASPVVENYYIKTFGENYW